MKKTIAYFGIMFLVLSMVGCTAKPKPTVPIDAFLTAIKADIGAEIDDSLYFTSDVTVFDSLNNMDNTEEAPIELTNKLAELLSAFEYTIVSETVAINTAVVKIDVKTYDLGGLMNDWVMDIMAKAFELAMNGGTEEEIKEYMFDSFITMADKSEKDLLKSVDVKLTLVDGKWKMDGGDANKALFNAITGDFLNFYETNPIFDGQPQTS